MSGAPTSYLSSLPRSFLFSGSTHPIFRVPTAPFSGDPKGSALAPTVANPKIQVCRGTRRVTLAPDLDMFSKESSPFFVYNHLEAMPINFLK